VPIEESEDKPGVILDYNKDGNIVGMEVLNASDRAENPRCVDYDVTAWAVYTATNRDCLIPQW
jgi:uncharacterized protein YuzE